MLNSILDRLKPRLFYGWWLVAAGFIIVAYGEGVRDFALGQLFRLVSDELGSSRSQVGFAITISTTVGTVSLLAIGPLVDRFGPRPLMLVGIPMAGIGYLGLSSVQGLLPIYLLQGTLIGVGASAGFLLPAQKAAANWFFIRRSLALAFISAAPVIGEALTILLEEVIASHYSWRSILLSLGLLMLAVGVPLALVMRHRPEQHGYLPDGRPATESVENERPSQRSGKFLETNFTLRQALRTRAFWLLVVASVLGEATIFMVVTSRVPLLMERGLAFQFVSLTFTITPFVGLVGILLFGYLGDMFSKRHLLALAIAIQSLSAFMLLVGGAVVQVVLYPLVFGLGSGTTPLILAIRADYFGRRAFATITVATMLVSRILAFAVFFLSVSSGRLHDATGSFIPGLFLSSLIGLAAAAIFLLARRPELPQPDS